MAIAYDLNSHDSGKTLRGDIRELKPDIIFLENQLFVSIQHPVIKQSLTHLLEESIVSNRKLLLDLLD